MRRLTGRQARKDAAAAAARAQRERTQRERATSCSDSHWGGGDLSRRPVPPRKCGWQGTGRGGLAGRLCLSQDDAREREAGGCEKKRGSWNMGHGKLIYPRPRGSGQGMDGWVGSSIYEIFSLPHIPQGRHLSAYVSRYAARWGYEQEQASST